MEQIAVNGKITAVKVYALAIGYTAQAVYGQTAAVEVNLLYVQAIGSDNDVAVQLVDIQVSRPYDLTVKGVLCNEPV